MIDRYFDNAATTPMDPRVLREMMPFLESEFGNANSIHGWGRRAESAVQLARHRVAQLFGAEDSTQVLFTSGASEANNWVLSGYATVTVSPFEHSSIYARSMATAASFLANSGLSLKACDHPSDLVSVMWVNNEIGTIFDPASCLGLGRRLHSDLTQALGKVAVDLGGLHYASASAHKLYGPKGIGALYCRDGAPPPLMLGGEQEMGARGGTLNVPGIVGFGAAAAIALDEANQALEHARTLRSIVLEELSSLSDVQIHGGTNVSPYILSVSFPQVHGESLVLEADAAGFAISSGAACSSHSTEPSHVLQALGVESRWFNGTVRISFGRYNKEDSARALAKMLCASCKKLYMLG